MKKATLSIVFLFALSVSFACPICGCGVGGFYVGLLPTYKGEFIGVRYQYARYETHLKDDPGQFSHDHYQIAELYGGIQLSNKWQLIGFIPYHINYQNTDDGVIRKNGLGDMSFLFNRNILQTSHLNTKKHTSFRQELWLGGGVKLPTGKNQVDFKDSAVDLEESLGDVNSQVGTGSLDFILNAMYNVHINNFGINTTVSYKINTENQSNFKYGNRFSVNSFGYYQAKLNSSISLAPNVGVLYEYVFPNKLQNTKVAQTGGYAALASAGVDVNIGKITVGTNVQLPFAQYYALGQTQYKPRGLVHVTYTF
jgi:hypothetical protein